MTEPLGILAFHAAAHLSGRRSNRLRGLMSEAGAGTEGAGRVIDVLLMFADESSLGVSQIARSLGTSKSVVHRILQTLVAKGMITPDGRRYRLGPAATVLGAQALHSSDLRVAANDVLHELRNATGETATLTALLPQGRVYLDQAVSQQEIKMSVELGRRFPLHAGSSGKCLLAFLPQERRDQLLRGDLPSLTPQTVIDPARLLADLANIRRRGYAISDGERQSDAASVAAPIFGYGQVILGALSVCGPRFRFTAHTAEAIAPAVVAAADRVSARMGSSKAGESKS